MGKRGRKTRWRTLTIADELSDSEESTSPSVGGGHRGVKTYHNHHNNNNNHHAKPSSTYFSRFSYSSQSTPTRRYQCDNNSKSTRSSSTASENKITFNEDEYTRITTPRQDVLFKKGYLNKPKPYQTQTSTGTSTTSTTNSTGNGTPDHQSTDLEYESQFVFPNAFLDQNGVYYVNSFDYPLMVYNPPTYYQEVSHTPKSKRDSTGSLTGESTSPNNEETSHDDVPQVYNIIYPGFYINGACQPQELGEVVVGVDSRRIKKRRRRKVSHSETDTYSDDDEEEENDEEDEDGEEDGVFQDDRTNAQKLLLNGLHNKENEEKQKEENDNDDNKKYDLKPDAEEFVPRAHRCIQDNAIPIEMMKLPQPPPQQNYLPPHPMPAILNPGEFNAFIPPPGLHFITPHPPPNFVNFIPNHNFEEKTNEEVKKSEEEEEEKDKKEEEQKIVEEKIEVPKNQIDIAKIVYKLEEAAKEQQAEEKAKEIKTTPIKQKTFVENKKRSKPIWKPVRNYSETLKTTPVLQQKHTTKQPQIVKIQEVRKKPEVVTVKPNQWISVSNRKNKRKNIKQIEDDFDVEENNIKDEEFESYDVNLLEDVIVPVKEPEIKEEPIVETKMEEKVVVVEEKIEIEPPKVQNVTEKNKKKSKKITRRVIIKDIDLSEKIEEVPASIPKSEPKPEPEPEPEIQKVEEVTNVTTPEKKTPKKKSNSKKKKKEQNQFEVFNSVVNDDSSYDFLLEPSLLDESHQNKTNVEISQELDKMIQRGMYSNLEEKIKSLNIEDDNSTKFFKTIIENISTTSRETSVEKQKLDGILIKNQLIPKPVILEPVRANLMKQFTGGDFLAEGTNPINNGVGCNNNNNKNDDLYPITKAVKEWMTRTRETTPDVEIFKSPSTILKEFSMSDDDITVFERETSEELEWDNEIIEVDNGGEINDDDNKTNKNSTNDEIEIYESQYGKNEDFLKIQNEVLQHKQNNGFPKHGNLPYRAICCSIM